MERVKFQIEHRETKDGKISGTQGFVTQWYNGRLKMKIGQAGAVVDADTGSVLGAFTYKGFGGNRLWGECKEIE